MTAATGDPFVGATAGWASGEALAVGLDVMGRVTEHAAVRVGAALQIMQSDSRMHEDAGETPRSDGFFDDRGLVRSESHELFEAILLTSANCFEERKLPYLAHLYDGVAHDGSVSASDALFLARTADQLTYRQLEEMAIRGRHRDDMVQAEFAHIQAEHARGGLPSLPFFANLTT